MTAQIFRSVDRGHLSNVRKQLSINPASLHATLPTTGQTPLHRAAAWGNAEMVRELLAHDAKYDVADNDGNTPLHLACKSGSLETVVALSTPDKRRILRFKNFDGQTALHVAVLFGTKETVRQLVAAGARVNTKDKEGKTSMDLVSQDANEVMQILSMKDSEMSAETLDQSQPFDRTLSPITPSAQQPTANKMSYDKNSQMSALRSRRMKHMSSSPEKGYARYNDATQRSLPRKQLQHHEMAIQGLQSELQDLGMYTESIENFMSESRGKYYMLETMSSCLESQDRQLAEIDQRLKFQEVHLRDLRPRINSIGDESRHNKKQGEDLRQMVETLKETARSSLGSVLTRVKEWEATTVNLKEGPGRQSDSDDGHQFQINQIEQQIIDANRLVKDAKAAADRSFQLSLGMENRLKEVHDRMTAIEDGMKETTATTATDDPDSEDGAEQELMKIQLRELLGNVDHLKRAIIKTAAQTDKIEESYKEHLIFERERKIEQDQELSHRESRILELRKVALEEENERRDFVRDQEEQRAQMQRFEQKVDQTIAQSQRDSAMTVEVETKIKLMEAELVKLHERLEEQEETLAMQKKKKNGCCVIV